MRLVAVTLVCLLFLCPIAPAMTQESSAEITFWESARDSEDPAELEAYLKVYPDGQFSALARIRLKKLKGSREPEAGNSAPVSVGLEAKAPQIAKERGFIGVEVRDPRRKVPAAKNGTPKGAEVVKTLSFGPAEGAGLKPGDIILKIDDEPVRGMRHFVETTAAKTPGTSLSLSIIRDGTPSQLVLTVGRFGREVLAAARKDDVTAMALLG